MADAPHQKWVSDITYIWIDEGWLYLAVVLEALLQAGHRLGNRRVDDGNAGL